MPVAKKVLWTMYDSTYVYRFVENAQIRSSHQRCFVKNDVLKNFTIFFSIRVFFHGHWRLTGQQGKGGDHLLFHSTNSTRPRTFRHLVATLHVRWLSHIFNHTACIYQTATRWDLPPYRITNRLTKCASHPDKTAGVIGLRRVTLLKRDSTTGVSLWNLW